MGRESRSVITSSERAIKSNRCVTRSLSIQNVAVESQRHVMISTYTRAMPRLWSHTIESHRRAVRDAAIDVTTALVADHGLRSVTMSEIAERTGIGRATLYKYFPDVGTILREWHEREIERHVDQLIVARDQATGPDERLRAVLEAFASIAQVSHGHHDAELAAMLHRDAKHVLHAEDRVTQLIEELLMEGVAAGIVRRDVGSRELAGYCIHALAAARRLRSRAAVRRLVEVTLGGLRPTA
jgi:AcrR family transcriptional regulator